MKRLFIHFGLNFFIAEINATDNPQVGKGRCFLSTGKQRNKNFIPKHEKQSRPLHQAWKLHLGISGNNFHHSLNGHFHSGMFFVLLNSLFFYLFFYFGFALTVAGQVQVKIKMKYAGRSGKNSTGSFYRLSGLCGMFTPMIQIAIAEKLFLCRAG